MLKEIRLQNFKAFGNVEQAIPCKPITLIFGENSSGKSSIFKAILALKQTYEYYTKNVNLLQTGKYVDVGPFEEFIFGHDLDNKFHIGFTISEGSLGSTNSRDGEIDFDILNEFDLYYRLATGRKYGLVQLSDFKFNMFSNRDEVTRSEFARLIKRYRYRYDSRRGIYYSRGLRDAKQILGSINDDVKRTDKALYFDLSLDITERRQATRLILRAILYLMFENEAIHSTVQARQYYAHRFRQDVTMLIENVEYQIKIVVRKITEKSLKGVISAQDTSYDDDDMEELIRDPVFLSFNYYLGSKRLKLSVINQEKTNLQPKTIQAILDSCRELIKNDFDQIFRILYEIYSEYSSIFKYKSSTEEFLSTLSKLLNLRLDETEDFDEAEIVFVEQLLNIITNKISFGMVESPIGIDTTRSELTVNYQFNDDEKIDLRNVSLLPLFRPLIDFSQEILQSIRSSNNVLNQLLNNITYLGPLREKPERYYIFGGHMPEDVGMTGSDTANLLYSIEEKLNDFNEALKQFQLGYVVETETIEAAQKKSSDFFSLYFIDEITKQKVALPDIGFGVSQVLPILTQSFLSDKTDEILLIEQPEIHLNPKLQSELGSFFKDQIKKRNSRKQFIIETHSEQLILRLKRLIRNGELTKDDIAINFIRKTENGAICKQIKIDENGNFMEQWPDDFFDLAFKEEFDNFDYF